MYIVLYDYNCNGRTFIAGNIINSINCSSDEISYLLSIGAIKKYDKSNVVLVKDKKEEIKTKKNTKSKKKVK